MSDPISRDTGTRSGETATRIQTDDVSARNHLSKTAVHGVADLDEVLVKQDQELPVETSCLGLAYEFHDYAARYVAVLVNVDCTFSVRYEKFAFAETEHA